MFNNINTNIHVYIIEECNIKHKNNQYNESGNEINKNNVQYITMQNINLRIAKMLYNIKCIGR